MQRYLFYSRERDESSNTRNGQNHLEVAPFNRHRGTSPAVPLIPSVSTAKKRAKIINRPAFLLPNLSLRFPLFSPFTEIPHEERNRTMKEELRDRSKMSTRSRKVGDVFNRIQHPDETFFSFDYLCQVAGLRDNLADFSFFLTVSSNSPSNSSNFFPSPSNTFFLRFKTL